MQQISFFWELALVLLLLLCYYETKAKARNNIKRVMVLSLLLWYTKVVCKKYEIKARARNNIKG